MPAAVSIGSPTTRTDRTTQTDLTDERPTAELVAEVGDLAQVCPTDARHLSKLLFARLRAADETSEEYSYVRATLIELNGALVRFCAGRFSHRREPLEDILQIGTVGLIKAIDRFDPSYDVEFSTFAIPTIAGEMKRFFRDTGWMVHVPRRLQELRLSVAKASDQLEQVLDRVPTSAELAEHLDLSEEEVREAQLAAEAQSAHSLDAPATESTGTAGSALAARLAFEETAYDKVLAIESLKPVIAGLPERERRILSLRFCEELTQLEIGRELGISQMHVSRLLTRTLATLRQALVT